MINNSSFVVIILHIYVVLDESIISDFKSLF